jgi:hypothetical protein
MPKAKIIFDLPEENRTYALASKYLEAHLCLFDFDNRLRSLIKYSHNVPEDVLKAYEGIRDDLHYTLQEYGIDLGNIE